MLLKLCWLQKPSNRRQSINNFWQRRNRNRIGKRRDCKPRYGGAWKTFGAWKYWPSATQGMIWPVEPTRGISAYFHDPSYPYRHIFEHSAIDIPHKQGDTIIAPLDGYVARVKSPAQVGTGMRYIMLVHDGYFNGIWPCELCKSEWRWFCKSGWCNRMRWWCTGYAWRWKPFNWLTSAFWGEKRRYSSKSTQLLALILECIESPQIPIFTKLKYKKECPSTK